MNKKIISATLLLLALPAAALAFNAGNVPQADQNITINGLIDLALSFIWPVLMVVVILLFAFAGFKFFTANGEEKALTDARNSVIWGVVGLVVVFLAWSIPFIIRNTLGV